MVALFFGRRWDHPALDNDAVQMVTPHGRPCKHCRELIGKRDCGLLRRTVRMKHTPITRTLRLIGKKLPGQFYRSKQWFLGHGKPRITATFEPIHAECVIRESVASLAHWEKRCVCYGVDDEEPYPGTPREEALAVVKLINKERENNGLGPIL